MVLAARRRAAVVGNPEPRLGPPIPARSAHHAIVKRAEDIGEPLRPWQVTATRFITGLAPKSGWLYKEIATLAARRNGKTTIMRPLIVEDLVNGRKIVHAAQDLKLPRQMHEEVATIIDERYRELLPSRRGIKYGVGQESIQLTTGGAYRIVSNTRSGARGMSNDRVLVDEVLELTSMDFVAAAIPTVLTSPWGQVIYFSNAGTLGSVVLQWLKARAENDPSLAYLEWSADPELAPDDITGWLQANPSIGHEPVMLANLESEFRKHQMGGSLDVWEREHLCRQTLARHESIVSAEQWALQEFVAEAKATRPSMGIKMDISGERASAVLAWQEADERVGLNVIADVEGHPIDTDRLGPDLQRAASKNGVVVTVYDPYTDADIARHMLRSRALTGRDYANASEKFVRLVAARQLRVQDDARILASDLSATVPRAFSGGSYIAVKASPETSNTAAEAAIRAAWLASNPRPLPSKVF